MVRCDWGHEANELRKFSVSPNSKLGLFICKDCWGKEIDYLVSQNQKLPDKDMHYHLPMWGLAEKFVPGLHGETSLWEHVMQDD